MDAKRSSDENVTVRSRPSNRVEQKKQTVESGNEDIGSSMQRIGSNLFHVAAASDHSSRLEPTTTDFPSDLLHVAAASDHSNKRWKLNRIPRHAVRYGAWWFCKFNGVFREAELIQLECYYLEIHLYQLFFELVCSTDIVWSWYIIWSMVWFRALCCVIGSWMFTILVEPMHNYFLNSFSMNMANHLAIMVSCWYFWTDWSYSRIRFSFIYNHFLARTK